MILRGILGVVIFLELRKECVALAAQANPAPSRAAWTGATSPLSKRWAPLQRARPSHFVCFGHWKRSRPLPGTLWPRRRWAALLPRGRAAGQGMPRVGVAAAQARVPWGRDLSIPAPRRVNNKTGAASPERYFPGSNKVGLAAFAPHPTPGRITVCKMGRNGQNLRAVWPLLHPHRYDVSFSFAKFWVSCKACSRPGAPRDGRVERRVLTGGSAEGRRARRA